MVQLYKYLIAATLTLFTIDPLAKAATKDVLQNLFNNLLTVLLDSVREGGFGMIGIA